MPDSTQFDSIAVVKMLTSFHRSLVSESDQSRDVDFVGTILERQLREKFDLDRPASRFDDKRRSSELKQFDMTFLMVKEANRALKDHRPDLAMEFVGRALALWSGEQPKSKGE